MPRLSAKFNVFVSLRKQFAYSTFTERVTLSKPFKTITDVSKFSIPPPSGTNVSVLLNLLHKQRIDEARFHFDRIPSPDVYLSTKMISCYIENLRLDEALQLFDEITVKDTVMWNLMIKGCVSCGDLEMGQKLFHELPQKSVVSWTTVIDALLKCRKIEEAKGLFWDMPVRDTAAWNAMIHGCFVNNRLEEAMKFFDMMPERNVISWTTMIQGLDQHKRSDEALSVFREMVGVGLKPSTSTFCCVVTACASAFELWLGCQVHAHIMKLGCVSDPFITASLITFYANCNFVDQSRRAFDEQLHINVVVWTSLLTGYSTNAKHEDALRVFIDMNRIGIVPNQSSFTSALNSVCEMEAIEWGRYIHSTTVKLGLVNDPFVGNSLVVLYTKCGKIYDGINAFNEIDEKNIVSWNSIIVGCAQHGCGDWALSFFNQMVKAGLNPDEITFTGLLNSCSHSGLLQKGRHFFENVSRSTVLKVKLEHYACMVDILCRSGELKEAHDLVIKMPMKANSSIWLALLSGCRVESNIEIAEHAAENIINIDPQCRAAYVMLSNIYASSGKWSDAARIRMNMKKIGPVKQPGLSWVTQMA